MCYSQIFWIKLLALSILFSTGVRALVEAKLVILGIFPLTAFILVLRTELVDKLVILGISPLTLFLLALRIVLVAILVVTGILFSMFLILAL